MQHLDLPHNCVTSRAAHSSFKLHSELRSDSSVTLPRERRLKTRVSQEHEHYFKEAQTSLIFEPGPEGSLLPLRRPALGDRAVDFTQLAATAEGSAERARANKALLALLDPEHRAAAERRARPLPVFGQPATQNI